MTTDHDPPESGFDLATGTYEDALATVGRLSEVQFADHEVTWALIKYFCAMVRDGNAGYWDEDFATAQWGGVISPPALLMTWMMAPDWRPWAPEPGTLLLAKVPLPDRTVISVECSAEFHRPMRVGDRLNVEERVVSVSERKTTAIGAGHFITTESVYRDGEGRTIAVYTHVLFRFTPSDGGAGGTT